MTDEPRQQGAIMSQIIVHPIGTVGPQPVTQEACLICGRRTEWWQQTCCGVHVFGQVIVGYQWNSTCTVMQWPTPQDGGRG